MTVASLLVSPCPQLLQLPAHLSRSTQKAAEFLVNRADPAGALLVPHKNILVWYEPRPEEPGNVRYARQKQTYEQHRVRRYFSQRPGVAEGSVDPL